MKAVWKEEGEGAPFAGPGFNPNIALQHSGQLLYDRQSEAGPPELPGDRGIDLMECIEDFRKRLVRDPDSGIPDADLDPLPRGKIPYFNRDLSFACELQRIREKVHQDLPDFIPIRSDRGNGTVLVPSDRKRFLLDDRLQTD